MIGNNSCGTHALYAGKTVDNVAKLRIVTATGEDLWVGEYDDAGYAEAVAAGGTLARLLGGLRETGRRYRAAVDAAFPDIPRRVSGYNLDQVLPGRPLHLARLLVGSESTLALTVEAELALSTSPRHRHLVVLGYPDIFVAADAVPSLVAFGLLGLEGMDDTLIGQSRAIGLNTDGIALLPPGRGWLLAEIGDDDPEVAERRTVQFLAGLPESVNAKRIDDPVQVKQIWSVRESGLAATALPPGKPPNHEGWEDAAVPPERLGEYLRRITSLWDRYGYYGAWYGHFGQGCVHTRNPFDLHTVSGLATFRAFLTDAADVVAELGGSISGEHGDGQARGELLARMFGPEVIEAFRTVKSLFDPAGILNPGKLVDPYPLDTNLRYGPAYRQARQATDTTFALARDGGSLQLAAERCVGVGRCRRDDTGVMCPSYRATRDERHSTRGRAKMLVEMFTGEVTDRSWRNNDVHDALELCLSCKGCAVDCPTGVDMATYKAEFNSHYYARRLRPRVMYALGLLPWVSRVATRIPRTSSGALEMRGIGPLLRRGAGVTTDRPTPAFARKPFRRTATARHLQQPEIATVVLWPDTFTDAFDPGLGQDVAAVLSAAGETVHIPSQWACCGRTLFDPGMLDLARRSLRHVLEIL
ncbi:MAG TPA: FAD-linked oxidase C-terminal domain-containing protein, partial [Nakamurella sp.]